MSVLGIFMSRSDAPGATISTDVSHFDAQVSDFAWLNAYAQSAPGKAFPFSHDIAAGNVTWYHWQTQGNTMNSMDDGSLHRFYDENGNIILTIEFANGTYAMQITGASTTTGAYTVGLWPNALNRIDLKIDMTTGIAVDLYVDGSGTAAASHSTADAGVRGKPATMVLTSTSVDHVYTSELYVADFDTRDTRPVKQLPDAVGNYSGWAGGYSELGDEESLTAADGAAAGDKVSVNVGAYPGPATPAGIKAVVLKVVGSKGASGPQNIDPFVRIAGADYSAGNINPAEVPLPAYVEWLTNPDTAVDWVVADLDTTEIGLEAAA